MKVFSSQFRSGLLALVLMGVMACGAEAAPIVAPTMIEILPGRVVMGADRAEWAAGEDEFPRHEVRVQKSFRISQTQVTRGEFLAFVAATGYRRAGACRVSSDAGWVDDRSADWRTPGYSQSDLHPVVCVSWTDAQAYIDWLNEESGGLYRLPTESEWALAARAGSTGRNFWGDSAYDSCTYGNVNDLSAKNKSVKVAEPCDDGYLYTSPVGTFAPNGFGLYDIQGNAWEWVADCWTGDYKGHPLDGSAMQNAEGVCAQRVARGGSWYDTPGPVRLEAREHRSMSTAMSFIGFRLAADAHVD
ncbi:MAG: formylglycine-generating enzyme family protein [Parvibaculaceae bacterium]|nr:formylglycine-generating enzyme family protein [Parvibaculaceae bacterium]